MTKEPKEPFVFYTGTNALRPNGYHTKKEFLDIMKRTYLPTNIYYRMYGESHNPKKLRKFTFMQWIKWSGAEIRKYI